MNHQINIDEAIAIAADYILKEDTSFLTKVLAQV